MRGRFLSLVLVSFLFLYGVGWAQLAIGTGKIEGASHVNLRSGPDVNYPARAVLREGEELSIEGEEKGWYRVALPDGRRGYVHSSLVRLAGAKAPEARALREVKEVKEEGGEAPRGPVLETERKEKPPPVRADRARIMRIFQALSWDVLWWVGGAVCIFVLGFICGGNYYLRRDRIRRNRLRF